jgi:hypothetical protein
MNLTINNLGIDILNKIAKEKKQPIKSQPYE